MDNKEPLRKLFRQSLREGQGLLKCESEKQAQEWAELLRKHLLWPYSVLVVRKKEINTFLVIREPENPKTKNLETYV